MKEAPSENTTLPYRHVPHVLCVREPMMLITEMQNRSGSLNCTWRCQGMEAAGTSRSGSVCSAAGSSSKLLFKAYDELWTLNGRTVLVSSLSLPLQAGRIRAAPYVQVIKTWAGKQMKLRASLLIWIWPHNWTTVKLVCKIFPICIAVRGFLRTLEGLGCWNPKWSDVDIKFY